MVSGKPSARRVRPSFAPFLAAMIALTALLCTVFPGGTPTGARMVPAAATATVETTAETTATAPATEPEDVPSSEPAPDPDPGPERPPDLGASEGTVPPAEPTTTPTTTPSAPTTAPSTPSGPSPTPSADAEGTGPVYCRTLGPAGGVPRLPGCPTVDPPSGSPDGPSGSADGGGTGGGSGGGQSTAPWVRCADGSWAPTAADCPVRRVQCPDSPVSVPVGQPCPRPASTRGTPVACWDGSSARSTAECPPGRTFCPGGVTVPLGAGCAEAAPVTSCPQGTVRVLGACTPVAPPGVPEPPPGVPVAREPEPGELRFDRYTVAAGDLLYAQGAGCTPGAETTLTADGELVGRTVADQDGRFETIVRFASFRPGHRPVAADCGIPLRSGIDMMLVSADTSVSASSVLLLFFLAAGGLTVHHRASGRRRSRGR